MARLGQITVEGNTLSTEHAGCGVTVEVARDERGRWRPVKVTIVEERGIAAEALRTLPLRALEAFANSNQLARFFLEAAAALATGETSGPPPSPPKQPPLKFAVPTGRGRRPDTFYLKVAKAYQWLASQGRAPASELAEINGVPITTVHRWVKEARARRLLAPGQKGRAI